MGKTANRVRKETKRQIRRTPLTEAERRLLSATRYRGSPHHKRNPGDFGLMPPAAPRPTKTLCDEAGIFERAIAEELFARAVARGLVSEKTTAEGLPKQLWVVDDHGRVFEAIWSSDGTYHGYPIRRTDRFFDDVTSAWSAS